MSFDSLNKDELADVAAFFQKDVVAADDEKGPTKKELVAALATDADDSESVSWEDYKEIYLPAKESGNTTSQAEEEEAEEEDDHAPVEEEDTSNYILIKYERKNPTYQVGAVTFTTRHPFASVKPELAEYLVKNVKGFRPAMASEVTDYYN